MAAGAGAREHQVLNGLEHTEVQVAGCQQEGVALQLADWGAGEADHALSQTIGHTEFHGGDVVAGEIQGGRHIAVGSFGQQLLRYGIIIAFGKGSEYHAVLRAPGAEAADAGGELGYLARSLHVRDLLLDVAFVARRKA